MISIHLINVKLNKIYCFESKEDSSYPFLVVDEDLNVLCESFEELEDAVENYLSENELDMSI